MDTIHPRPLPACVHADGRADAGPSRYDWRAAESDVTTVKRSIDEIDLGRIDWAKVDRTTEDDIARQIASDPDTAPDMAGRRAEPRHVRPPAEVDVKAIRTRLGLSQTAFARRYGFNRRTLQDWEQRRRPEGPARLLLQIIDRAPELVERIFVDQS